MTLVPCTSLQLHVTSLISGHVVSAGTSAAGAATGEAAAPQANAAPASEAVPMDEDALLQQALAMSMQVTPLISLMSDPGEAVALEAVSPGRRHAVRVAALLTLLGGRWMHPARRPQSPRARWA